MTLGVIPWTRTHASAAARSLAPAVLPPVETLKGEGGVHDRPADPAALADHAALAAARTSSGGRLTAMPGVAVTTAAPHAEADTGE